LKTSHELMLTHMQEWLRASRIRSINWLRINSNDDDILRDAYISALTSGAESAIQIRKYYDGWEADEAFVRKRVQIFMQDFCANQSRILRNRARLIRENGELIIENTHSKSQQSVAAMRNIFGLRLDDEEKILVCWKMDIISTEDAMTKISCSRSTLYNKWLPLREALKEML
jgi:hypothetical protein